MIFSKSICSRCRNQLVGSVIIQFSIISFVTTSACNGEHVNRWAPFTCTCQRQLFPIIREPTDAFLKSLSIRLTVKDFTLLRFPVEYDVKLEILITSGYAIPSTYFRQNFIWFALEILLSVILYSFLFHQTTNIDLKWNNKEQPLITKHDGIANFLGGYQYLNVEWINFYIQSGTKFRNDILAFT